MTIIGPLATLAVVLAYRLRRRGREQRLAARFLWLAPSLYLAVIALVLARHSPGRGGLALLALGLLAGVLLGWLRGGLFALRRGEQEGELLLRRSRWAVTMLVGIVALRFLANLWVGADASGHLALALTDGALGLVFGLILATRLRIAHRARALLAGRDGRR